MLGKCFSILTIPSLLYAVWSGRMGAVTAALFDGASRAVEVALSLLGVTALWAGFLEVLVAAGAIKRLSRLLSPLLRLIFPDTYPDGPGAAEITACVSANLLGVSNAATPFALRAMEKMAAEGEESVAGRDMITLVLLSASGLSLFPTSVVALRRAAGSADPTSILLPVWIASSAGSLFSVLASRLLGGGKRHG